MSFSPFEKKSLFYLSLLYVLRLAGNFLVLPIFQPYANSLTGGHSALWTGLALGIFGFSQAMMQIPMGWISDRLGRRQVIAVCLIFFAISSYWCSFATSIVGLVWGRFVQGLCAYSSVVTALLADHMAPQNRTKASAMIGISIALTFAISFSASPLLAAAIGAHNLFKVIALFAFLSLLIVRYCLPSMPFQTEKNTENFLGSLRLFIHTAGLTRIVLSGCLLHAILSSFWLVFPYMSMQHGHPLTNQGLIYGPAVFFSFLIMGLIIVYAERTKKSPSFLPTVGFILLAVGQFFLHFSPQNRWTLVVLLLVFFAGFNSLEAVLPATMAQRSPEKIRGTAMGIYSTGQFMGIFLGGTLSGVIIHYTQNAPLVFLINAALCIVMALFIGVQRINRS